MGHLMNTEFVHWNGRSYKIKGRDKVEMDRIMSNYRPFQAKVEAPVPEKLLATGGANPTPIPKKVQLKPQAKKKSNK